MFKIGKLDKIVLCFLAGFLFFGAVRGETFRVDSTPEFDYALDAASDDAAVSKYLPLKPAGADQWYHSTYWAGDVEWCRVGRDWHHPGEAAASVRTFTVPRDGEVALTGEAAKYHVDPGTDGVTVRILLNENELWTADIDGGDERGWRFYIRTPVQQGDVFRFVVDKRANIACDTTRFDPTIQYVDAPEERYTASEGFLETADGDSPWRYESFPILTAPVRPIPENYASDFGAMIQYEWLREDKIAPNDGAAYLESAKKHLARSAELLDDLSESLDAADLEKWESDLNALQEESALLDGSDAVAAQKVYARVRGLKRKIAFANPLTDFGELLFVKRVPTSYSHLVMQYFGWRARKGGGIFLLEEPGRSLQCRDLFEGRLANGSVLEPRLSFDAKKLVFSFVDLAADKKYDPYKVHFTDTDDGFYHVWTANTDGSALTQITDGSFDDITPNWLPDGKIVFSSTRRRGYARCFWWGFGERWHVYTIHTMNADGSGIKTLSWHDTNEWFPEISHDGQIVYARWDYIDRDAVTHQNLWVMRPDGTNPRALWGNATEKPHCTFQAKPIPDSGKYVFTASAHHSITGGPVTLLDASVGADGVESLEPVTPEIPFPEAESRNIPEYYDSPRPLSEKYFLVSYSPWPLRWEGEAPNREEALGIYLLDVFGNRELIYRDPAIGATNPTPLVARPTPPLLPSQLPADAPDWGEMSVTDVYQGLGSDIERGTIKALRVVQLFPKVTRDADDPLIGAAREENGRAILGVVPVESDGSAFFRVPARKPFYLQALDENGFAYQTMRSLTYLQPGEKISCVGCHESRDSSAYSVPEHFAADAARPLAQRRAPSTIEPGPFEGRPFSYAETIQPILDAKCVSCHCAKKKDGGIDLTGGAVGEGGKAVSVSYAALTGDVNFWEGGTNPENALRALVPRFGGRNPIQVTEPGGRYQALGSRLMKLLRDGHEQVTLTDEEIRLFATWIDLNAIFSGTGEPAQREAALRGEPLPMPQIE